MSAVVGLAADGMCPLCAVLTLLNVFCRYLEEMATTVSIQWKSL